MNIQIFYIPKNLVWCLTAALSPFYQNLNLKKMYLHILIILKYQQQFKKNSATICDICLVKF